MAELLEIIKINSKVQTETTQTIGKYNEESYAYATQSKTGQNV